MALDFDGTLAPLVTDPTTSRATPTATKALGALCRIDRLTLAIVSGRPIDVLTDLAAPPEGTLLVGSHGAELGRATRFGFEGGPLQLDPDQEALLQVVRAELEAIAAHHRDVWVEHKPAAAVLHTRPATPEIAQAATQAALAGPGARPGLAVLAGKQVVELGVLHATKGSALTTLRDETGACGVLFIGDDVTDEYAFGVLHDGRNGRPAGIDVGVKVGEGPTEAEYRLADPHAVAELLITFSQFDSKPPLPAPDPK